MWRGCPPTTHHAHNQEHLTPSTVITTQTGSERDQRLRFAMRQGLGLLFVPWVAADTLCSRYPKICQGTWSCLCQDGLPGPCGDSTSDVSCSIFAYYENLSGTIPTQIGLYKDMLAGGYLNLAGNLLSGTIPTELSGWRGNCQLWERRT